MRYLLRILASLCAIVPVAALAGIIASTAVHALPAIRQVGFGLLGDETVQFSMRAPLWGTFVVSAEALILGLPLALALAIIMREFQVPLVSRALGAIVGTLGGIPPVIYAVCTLIAVRAFMAPKFAAAGIESFQVKAAILGEPATGFGGLADGIPNSTFLGGVLLALLIVPFMTPLVDDAIRGVPAELKNGSIALGATRWYTLQRIVLPSALPGIVSAATLGYLLAIGEVIIPYFVLGGAANVAHIPNPIWDIFRATPALTAWGASQMGGLGGEGEGTQAIAVSVSFAAGLLLLMLAFLVMGLERAVLRRLRVTQ